MARQIKDSGVDWIGKIPKEWEVCKLKKLITFINGYPFDSSVMGDEGNCSVVRIGDLQNNGVAYDTALKVEYHDGLSKYLIRNDDILIAMSGATVGKFAIVNNITKSACVNQRVGIIRSNISGYLKYVLASSGFSSYITLLSEGTAQPNISTTNINNFSICIPPPAETQIIIAYLDTKCAEIDKVVEQTRATIVEYKKLKQAIITEAVTKGVRGARPMKPSGVEWIGDIPEEWRVGRIKDFAQLQTGATPSTSCPHYFNGEIPWFTPGDFSESFEVTVSQRTLSKQAEDEKQAVILPPQTPLLVGIGASAGKVSFSQVKCSCNQQVTALIECSANPKLLTYILEAGRVYLRDTAAFTTLPIINNQTLGYFKIAVPTCVAEQQEIATYLDTKCAEIDRIIEKKEQLIKELGSYKKSLIYEYVTGKKEIKIHNYSQNTIY
ncbi:MAG: restriction endonuclease subunit S [Akkermansia sp.]|nr:restriction endonuclease subunit S [Akkermansia sp.]